VDIRFGWRRFGTRSDPALNNPISMAIHVALRHVTHYTYDTAVGHGPHVIRLRPAPHCRTPILSYSQKITGGEHFLHWQQDPFSNWNARVVFPDPMLEMKIEIEVVAEMAVYNPFDFFLDESANQFPFEYGAVLAKDLEPFRVRPESSPKLDALVGELRQRWMPPRSKDSEKTVRTIDLVVGLNQHVQQAVRYLIRLEPGVQTAEETLTLGSGSCRDSAWLLVQLFRSMGLAARFVSGYLIQLAPDQKSLDGPSGTEVDFTDLHAWCEVYLPGGGWIGLDPTSGLLAGEGHIPLSCTPEPSTAAPVTGGIGKCESKLHHEMQVTRIYESPRVTKPYSEAQWARIQSLGHRIDEDLQAGDVRLTMGGEPTFVSVDDPEGAEWNFTAVSPAKRVLSGTLLKRLRSRMAPGSLLHYGQGKWYPGEPLPRWALSAFWRKDGVPIWKDDSLIADESKDYGHGTTEAGELIRRLARNLGANPAHVLPAYEDLFYYTWKERRLPSNVSPTSSNWKNAQERERLARVFQRGLGEVVGYALPIEVAGGHGGSIQWRSGAWFLRDGETLWLIPGDSAMGLRLPLDSIPWVTDRENPWIWPQDPSAPLPPLPREFAKRLDPSAAGQAYVTGAPAARQAGMGPGQRAQTPLPARDPREGQAPAPGQSAPWIVRTALCVEPREGRLHIFLPPVSTAESYLDLVSTIESTVSAMGVPVILEGEAPPRDPRLNKLSVTPDPGVIEVNLHPSRSWGELVDRTTVLYEEARQTRLRAEKFMLDGRHSGTGGGNHIILGGETPGDSPILRRPDLLRSLLGYWQNHPSLSWLFSGLFVGPTSQAPRVDEARNDSLYELEVAFRELERQTASHGPAVPPWLVDRLFRNLLIDSSGNTHRSEFSIDKLFAPESATGRLGLVEMRAFEMPPHAQMSLAQHLLLRGLVSTFWKKPYTQELVRWGTDLHDRWMLPHFCETDFREVIRDLREAGYPFEMEWFAPQFEFRFPRIGDFAQRDVRVEIRSALEPWHVLGEEPGGGGTVRYVDSSLERVQVQAQGLIGKRFALTVNGRRLPMHPTGTQGEAVAGVRYRAWQPPVCLQPTIGAHAPLTFDLYDTWNERSIGGCTYYVAHPGGRNYETFPVNAYEAESRRLARFFATGATQGRFVPKPEALNADFPVTLDLRR
jgi:uncharacterized protein (DUF2126 family)/transglutaminase-like putative cysteine protease